MAFLIFVAFSVLSDSITSLPNDEDPEIFVMLFNDNDVEKYQEDCGSEDLKHRIESRKQKKSNVSVSGISQHKIIRV